MFKVALVQNQSEMAHYGYADARPLISSFGYEVELYTADNIDSLGSSLARNRFDAVVFGSNALNDKTIFAETAKDSFRQCFQDWLARGRGCLCLHQLRLATSSENVLTFLPAPFNQISAEVRPATEKSAAGQVGYGPNCDSHILLLYPNRITPLSIQQNCLRFRSLPGLYWHTWKNANLADCEEILVDPEPGRAPRPLLISSRDPRAYRLVLSALTLDWQKQIQLLHNIMIYLVEGRHNTGIVIDERNRNTAFDYLIGTLQSRKFPFKPYFLTSDLQPLHDNITSSVHSLLVLGPFVPFSKLPTSLTTTILQRVSAGQLKLVTIEDQDPDVRRFSVAGRERTAIALLHTVELNVQGELRHGYIDGSFWSTAETLQILHSLGQGRATYKTLVGETLELAQAHDRDGSYDEVFGVSCAFLWMRATFLGLHAVETESTLSWIRARMSNYEAREQALALMTFAELGVLSGDEQEILVSLLSRLEPNKLSEIDLVEYLRAAIISGTTGVIAGLVRALEQKQQSGAWVDLATTATAVATLVEVAGTWRVGATSSSYADLKPLVERMMFSGIIYIQDALERSRAADDAALYPWDGKASTTTKCIQAWLRFEELIDLPVHELAAALRDFHDDSTQLLAGAQALSVLEDLKQDNARLLSQVSEATSRVDDMSSEIKLAHHRRRKLFISRCAIAIITYLFASLFFALALVYDLAGAWSVLRFALIDGWAFHLTFLALIGAFLGLPWRKWIGGTE